MIEPVTLFFLALGYLSTLQKKISMDNNNHLENQQEIDDLFKDLNIYIFNYIYFLYNLELCFMTKDIQNIKHN